MIDLVKMTPFGRKQWVKKKFEDYEKSENTKAMVLAKKSYEKPTDKTFKDNIERSKWKVTIDRKVNYLLGRAPVSKGYQAQLDELLKLIKETAREYLLRGSLIWIVQGDGKSVDARPFIMNNTMTVYEDESKETVICFIRKRTDIEVAPDTGAETEVDYYECYYKVAEAWVRDTFCFSDATKDIVAEGIEKLLFIELGKTGDAPLYAYVEEVLKALDNVFKHQDKTVVKNTKPLVEVRGYSGTSDEDLEYAIENRSIARTEGNGGVTLHSRSMDSTSIDLWVKRLMQEFYEATATVGKDNELTYAQSGKAMDRLFIDMTGSANELSGILEEALVEYFNYIGKPGLDIVWNTDRPVDDVSTIGAIMQSRGLLSDETLIEQHPWVTDIQKEKERLAAQSAAGFTDLVDDNEF